MCCSSAYAIWLLSIVLLSRLSQPLLAPLSCFSSSMLETGWTLFVAKSTGNIVVMVLQFVHYFCFCHPRKLSSKLFCLHWDYKSMLEGKHLLGRNVGGGNFCCRCIIWFLMKQSLWRGFLRTFVTRVFEKWMYALLPLIVGSRICKERCQAVLDVVSMCFAGGSIVALLYCTYT